MVLTLVAQRADDKTICPSEVARLLAAGTKEGPNSWRDYMPVVHQAVDGLLREELVQLSWKGQPLVKRCGPYRIARRDCERSRD